MVNIINALITSICITIPEDIFMVVLTLRFMGRKEMLDFYNMKENIISILKISIPPALTINILNFIIKTPSSTNRLISYVILYSLLVYILKQRAFIDYPKLYQKTFAYFILTMLTAVAVDTITYPIILKLVNKTYQNIISDIYLVILCSLPSRIVDIMILTYIFIKKNSKFQINIIDYISKNRFFMKLTMCLAVGLILFEAYVIKLIIWNDLLNIVNTIYEQMFIVIGSTFLIPALIISIVYLCINYCVMIINSEKQTFRNE